MFSIDDISQNHAVICLDVADGHIFVELTLDDKCERMCGDNHNFEYFWDEHTPIIKSIQGLDDDGSNYPLPSSTTKLIEHLLDCDEFYTAYQNQFDDNFEWGENTSRHYYTA